tara:strand:+ start:5493 stop:5882 length:390 start_codon:yes stop_codon:yes gene_type:complete
MDLNKVLSELMSSLDDIKDDINDGQYIQFSNKIMEIKQCNDSLHTCRECLVLYNECRLTSDNYPIVRPVCKNIYMKMTLDQWEDINDDICNKGFHFLEDDNNNQLLYEGTDGMDCDILIDSNPVIVKVL